MILIFITLFLVFSLLCIAVVFIISDRYESGYENMMETVTDALEKYHIELDKKYEQTRYGKLGILYERNLIKSNPSQMKQRT